MKRTLALAFVVAALAGCGTLEAVAPRTTGAVEAAVAGVRTAVVGDPSDPTGAEGDLQKQSLLQFEINDLEAAAVYAETNGYPARAAVHRAHAARLVAVRAQLRACLDAIRAAKPKLIPDGTIGFFLLKEMAAEKIAQGIPAAVKVNCTPIASL
jgi:hypothetical protein